MSHSRKIRRIFYIHSRVRPRSCEKIKKLYKRVEKLQARVEKEGLTKWLTNTITALEKKACHYNLTIKVLPEDKKSSIKPITSERNKEVKAKKK